MSRWPICATAAGKSTPAALRCRTGRWGRHGELGDDHRRIEGLVAPGTFNIDPAAPAEKHPGNLISAGAVSYLTSGLVDTARSLNLSPYNMLVVASLVQQEAKRSDFAKVAQVIYNRLQRAPQARVRLDGELPVGPPGSGHHRRRPCAANSLEHLHGRGGAGDGDLFARRGRVTGGRTSRAQVTGCTSSPSTPRGRRCSPGTISSIWRISSWPSTTVSSTARDERSRAGRGGEERHRRPAKPSVLGSPIAHSRSPQLHLAAYRALGLHDWTYERIECGAESCRPWSAGSGRSGSACR